MPQDSEETKAQRNPGKSALYWRLKRIRRGSRRRIGAWIGGGETEPAPLAPLDPAGIHRVLACRINRRLGNMLFFTSMLRSLGETLPGAEIDVLVMDPSHADLFRTLPGVAQIHQVPQRSWRWPFQIIAFFWRLRRRHYDLAIDPTNNSVSNRVVTRLAGARITLGFWVRNQIFGVSHPVSAYINKIRHETLKPLVLLSAAFPADGVHIQERMGLALTEAELAEGKRLLAATAPAGNAPVVGFFTEATGKKRLQPEWWRAWIAAMQSGDDAPRLLQILPPGPVLPLVKNMAHVCCPEHRRLAALQSQLDLFVSADAGPLHLASAAGTTVAGLFIHTKPEAYGPRGPKDLVLHGPEPDPVASAAAVRRHLAGLKP